MIQIYIGVAEDFFVTVLTQETPFILSDNYAMLISKIKNIWATKYSESNYNNKNNNKNSLS